jgi:hypothetical protein
LIKKGEVPADIVELNAKLIDEELDESWNFCYNWKIQYLKGC